jgi:hypothetical protein
MPLQKKDPFFRPYICGISWSPVDKKARVLERACIVAKRGQNVPFLREKRPFKKMTPKVGANIGALTGILLIFI